MAKRFTETNKWRDRWFRSLPPDIKCVWWYLTDNCDNAGVIEPDYEFIEFVIGAKLPWPHIEKALNGRIVPLKNGAWWIPKFIRFQYGVLSEDCPPHQNVIDLLHKHSLWEKYRELEANGYKGIMDGQQQSLSLHLPAGDEPASKTASDKFEEFWKAWPKSPRKVDKTKCLRYWLSHSLDDHADAISEGLKAWIVSESWTKDDGEYIPLVYTWLNNSRWENPPMPRKAGSAPAKKRQFDQLRYDQVLQEVAQQIWDGGKDNRGQLLAILRDKYKDTRNRMGQPVVDEALDLVHFRESRGGDVGIENVLAEAMKGMTP